MNNLGLKNEASSKNKPNASQRKATVQPKLMVNAPGDRYEREADAMADRVMRMAESPSSSIQSTTALISRSIQRKCSACEEEEKKKKGTIRRKARPKADSGGGFAASPGLVSQLNATQGGGRPLPDQTRNFMEGAFSTDFSGVRVHTDSQAAEMSQGIQAKAFTYGSDVYFNQGEFSPESFSGRRLLAHELGHVVQQGGEAHNGLHSEFTLMKKGIARYIDDWLEFTPNYRQWTFSELIDELDEIEQWLNNQTQTTTKSIRLTEVFEELQQEVIRRNQQTTVKRRKRKWRKTPLAEENDIKNTLQFSLMPKPMALIEQQSVIYEDSQEMEQELKLITAWLTHRPDISEEDQALLQGELDQLQGIIPNHKKASTISQSEFLPKPRVLLEQTSVPYTDPAEIRAELDLIMVWLRRTELSTKERRALEDERGELMEALFIDRSQLAAIRRYQKIQQAISPQNGGDGHEQLLGALQLIEQTRDTADQFGNSLVFWGDETILITKEEMMAIEGAVIVNLLDANSNLHLAFLGIERQFKDELDRDRRHRFASTVVGLFTTSSTIVTAASMDIFGDIFNKNRQLFKENIRKKNLIQAGRAIIEMEKALSKATKPLGNWINSRNRVTGNIIIGLTITKELSFTIVTTYLTAGYGSAAIAGRAKGVVGTVRTLGKIGGIATTSGLANAGVRVSTNLLGQSIAGGPIDYSETFSEAKTGFRRGFIDSLTGITTVGTASALRFGPSTLGRVGKGSISGSVGGLTVGALDSSVDVIFNDKPLSHILKTTAYGGVTGLAGGAFGGLVPGRMNVSSPRYALAETFAGGVSGAVTARIMGQDPLEGALIGVAASSPFLLVKPNGKGNSGPLSVRIVNEAENVVSRANSTLEGVILNGDRPFLNDLLRNRRGTSPRTNHLLRTNSMGQPDPSPRFYGQAMELLVRREFQNSSFLSQFISRGETLTRITSGGKRVRGFTDFTLEVGNTRLSVDLTTTRARQAHADRFYGENLLQLTYDTPF